MKQEEGMRALEQIRQKSNKNVGTCKRTPALIYPTSGSVFDVDKDKTDPWSESLRTPCDTLCDITSDIVVSDGNSDRREP